MLSATAASVSKIVREDDSLVIVWEDGQEDQYPHLWLRDNAPENLNPFTGEKLSVAGDGPAPCSPWSVYVEYDETLVISWAGLKEVNRFPLDALRNSPASVESLDLAFAAD